jgi:uncharacterized membrane protein HdeD (DUF308 family)
MIKALTKNWWVFIVRGLIAILFGILALVWPELTLIVLVWSFGAFVLVDGLFSVYSGLTRHKEVDRWWVILIEGIFGIAFGVLAFIWPSITGLVLLALIVAWALVTGIFEIIAAVKLRKTIENEWFLAFSGVLSILLGVAMLLWPGAGAVALAWLIGVYAVIFGITLIALGFRLRKFKLDTGEELKIA